MIELYGRMIIEKAYLKMLHSTSTRPRKSSKEAYLEFVNLYPEIMKVVPLKQIANYLNIQPESLSRIRRQLATGN